MSTKSTIWYGEDWHLYHYYARTVKDAQRLWEILEAVRVAGELRAKAAEVANIWRYREDLMETDRMTLEQAMNGWLARYDSLTASTGGSSDEPQKEIRE